MFHIYKIYDNDNRYQTFKDLFHIMMTRANIIDKIFTLMLVSVFFTNGITKLLNLEQTINWVESFNFYSEIVYLGILVELIIPVMILMNIYKKIAIYIMIIFCLVTAFMFHLDLSNPMQLTQFLKNIGLAAGFYFLDKSEQHNYFRN